MTIRSLAIAVAAAMLAFGPFPARAHDHMHHDIQMEAPQPLPGRSIYNLDSNWTTQDGTSVGLDALAGGPIVAAMGYTTCKDICPAIVADMMWVEKHLPADAVARVHFAFFSFDSAVDTPARLKAYADEHGLDPGRWTLYHGDEDAVRELAAALGVAYRPDGRGGFDHAAVISLIDEKGEIVFQQRGTQASSDDLLARLNTLLGR